MGNPQTRQISSCNSQATDGWTKEGWLSNSWISHWPSFTTRPAMILDIPIVHHYQPSISDTRWAALLATPIFSTSKSCVDSDADRPLRIPAAPVPLGHSVSSACCRRRCWTWLPAAVDSAVADSAVWFHRFSWPWVAATMNHVRSIFITTWIWDKSPAIYGQTNGGLIRVGSPINA